MSQATRVLALSAVALLAAGALEHARADCDSACREELSATREATQQYHKEITALDDGYLPTDKDLPPRAVLVTFDDGYHDLEEQAWPILRRHKIPVTLFVPTAYPDHPERTFWWDDLYQALQKTNRNRGSAYLNRHFFPVQCYITRSGLSEVKKLFKDFETYRRNLESKKTLS